MSYGHCDSVSRRSAREATTSRPPTVDSGWDDDDDDGEMTSEWRWSDGGVRTEVRMMTVTGGRVTTMVRDLGTMTSEARRQNGEDDGRTMTTGRGRRSLERDRRTTAETRRQDGESLDATSSVQDRALITFWAPDAGSVSPVQYRILVTFYSLWRWELHDESYRRLWCIVRSASYILVRRQQQSRQKYIWISRFILSLSAFHIMSLIQNKALQNMSVHRAGASNNNASVLIYYAYYINMYIPLLDGLWCRLTDRFRPIHRKVLSLMWLIPVFITSNFDTLWNLPLNCIPKLLPETYKIRCEFTTCKHKWTSCEEAAKIKTAVSALQACQGDTLPNIKYCYKSLQLCLSQLLSRDFWTNPHSSKLRCLEPIL